MNISVTADGSLLSPTGGVNTIHPAPEIHEHFMIHNESRWYRDFDIATQTDLSAAAWYLRRVSRRYGSRDRSAVHI